MRQRGAGAGPVAPDDVLEEGVVADDEEEVEGEPDVGGRQPQHRRHQDRRVEQEV